MYRLCEKRCVRKTVLLLKYALLNSFEKNEVQNFIDFILSKKKKTPTKLPTRKTLPQVSVWQEDDLAF